MTPKSKKRMFWIFIISGLTAGLAVLSGYLQYRQQIQDAEDDLAHEQELTEAYRKLNVKSDSITLLQQQLIDKSSELQAAQTEGINQMLGGSSFCRAYLGQRIIILDHLLRIIQGE